ncbi:hypothetical protein FNF31_01879 [Cafeteria roenbergensis]|uniref:Methylated-DNA--protein-cysteine methyltransferase n=1 Tax=Cafeteria roenbergensis TaxID=33653 RepID=A0A5A8DLJ5_CAFRO|nr:hypothetical protein FNF31_01879 [Cafeteria roenbergensis]
MAAARATENWAKDIQTRADISAFRRAALELCARVPRGSVVTYQALADATAKATGAPKSSARAAGGAMRHNPFAPSVPCHRVVTTSLKLGGFSGSSDPDGPNLGRKTALLLEEGVGMDAVKRTVDAGALYRFTEADIAHAAKAWAAHTAFLEEHKASSGSKRPRASSPAPAPAEKRTCSDGAAAAADATGRVPGHFSSPAALRAACSSGAFTGQTAGQCPGYAQANLVIVPAAFADDFALFCERNPKPCPLLEQLAAGDPVSRSMAPGADIRTALPRYRIWRDGVLAGEADSAEAAWAEMAAMEAGADRGAARDASAADAAAAARGGPVAFLLGCSFSFEEAMEKAGLPVRHVQEGRNVPMFATTIETKRAGRFHGGMVVSMRPMTSAQAEEAARVTGRFARVHGAPVHSGDPAAIGVKDVSKPDFGEAVTVKEGEIPVFWACGVTPQLALQQARLPLAITHSPGHMLVLDSRNEDLATA